MFEYNGNTCTLPQGGTNEPMGSHLFSESLIFSLLHDFPLNDILTVPPFKCIDHRC